MAFGHVYNQTPINNYVGMGVGLSWNKRPCVSLAKVAGTEEHFTGKIDRVLSRTQ